MITKTTMAVIFNLQNSHLLTLSLPTEEVFQVNGLLKTGARVSRGFLYVSYPPRIEL